jgi:hypothetical protein
MKQFLTVLLLSVGLLAQNTQHQNQRQQQNVGNTTTNSHNVSNSAAGGTANASGGQSSAVVGGQTSSTSYSESIPRQTATAIAPQPFHTSPCVKSWGGAAQAPVAGLSLGGGKVDKGCDIRETAEQFRNAGSMVAFCKLMITEPSSVKAGITMDDCMLSQVPTPSPTVELEPQSPPIVIQEAVSLPLEVLAPPVLAAPKSIHKHVASKNCPTGEK